MADVPLLPPQGSAPCGACPHPLIRHAAGPEGQCLDCGCMGWTPAPPPPSEPDPLAEVVLRFVDVGDPLYLYPARSPAVRLRQLLKHALRMQGFRSEGFVDGKGG